MASATSISRELRREQLTRRRCLPCGAELQSGVTRFRLWAPDAHEVELLAAPPGGESRPRRLRARDGWHELFCEQLPAGSRYQYRIDRNLLVPDPAARFNPLGVHGPSEVIDPLHFAWSDCNWRGRPWHEAVIYFCDYQGELARAITAGRRNEFASFQVFADPAALAGIPDPNDAATFVACKLAWTEREQPPHRQWLDYTRELLQVRTRRVTPLIPRLLQQRATYSLSGSLLSVEWPLENEARLTLRANLGEHPAEPITFGAEAAAALLFRSAAPGCGPALAPWEVQLRLA